MIDRVLDSNLFPLWLVAMAAFHGAAGFFAICDARGWFRHHKTSVKKERLTYGAMLPRILLNQCAVLLPALLLLEWSGCAFARHEVLPLWLVAVHVIGVGLYHDVVFYAAHRWVLHTRWGMRRLGHRLHHKTRANVAASSMYMTMPDYVLEIVVPFLGYFVIFPVHDLRVIYLVAVIGTLGGVYEHSGYNFFRRRASFDTRMHWNHHNRRYCSFSEGVLAPGFLDRLLRTGSRT